MNRFWSNTDREIKGNIEKIKDGYKILYDKYYISIYIKNILTNKTYQYMDSNILLVIIYKGLTGRYVLKKKNKVIYEIIDEGEFVLI